MKRRDFDPKTLYHVSTIYLI